MTKQLVFLNRRVWVAKSKTEYGEGRPIPMNDRAFMVMTMWAEAVLNREPEHYAFPTEKCGAAGDDFKPLVYATEPTEPIGDWKEAWEAAKERANVSYRFHELRHTACSRMWRREYPSPLWRRSRTRVRQLPLGCRGATGTLDRRHSARR